MVDRLSAVRYSDLRIEGTVDFHRAPSLLSIRVIQLNPRRCAPKEIWHHDQKARFCESLRSPSHILINSKYFLDQDYCRKRRL
jgi:hypothetical protein